ncbi:MAG TPA: ABC transporter permease subunit [Chloroflexota bacterium]|nr:ABC transporter permease subunit [Chloroflexota bacterium]
MSTVVFSGTATLTLLVLVLYPLVAILIQSILPDLFAVPARLSVSLDPFGRVFSNPEVLGALINTAWLGAAVACFGTLLGAGMAVLIKRTDLPGRRLFNALVWVTLFTPTYLIALAWELLFSRGGFIDSAIAPLPDGVINTIFSPVGLIMLLVLRLAPFAYLATSAALHRLGAEYDEAARLVGAPLLQRWLRINGPLLAPALLAGALIIFAEAISDYGTAATIAQQAGFNLVTYELYAAINSVPVDFALSAALSCLLVAIIAIALLLQTRVLRARSYQVITGRSRSARQVQLGLWRIPAMAAIGLYFAAALVLPLLATGGMSCMRNLSGGFVSANLGWDNYRIALNTGGEALLALWRSTLLALGAATLVAFLGLAIAFTIERTRLPGRRLLRLLTTVTLALPGVVLAVGYIFAWNEVWMQNLFGNTPYGTLGLLFVAYCAGSLPFGVRLATGALAQVGTNLLDAGRLAGGGTARLFRGIIVPLLAPTLLSTWLLVFTHTLFELPTSQLLQPPGQPPLPALIVRQFTVYSQGPATAMTMLALAVVTVGVLAIVCLARLARTRWAGASAVTLTL